MSHTVEHDGHTVATGSHGEPATPLQRLAAELQSHDLAMAGPDGNADNLPAEFAATSFSIGILRGAAPLFREERKLLRKYAVREARDWIGTITCMPRGERIHIAAEAYGPKGLEQLDEETGRMVLISPDDSLVIVGQLLHSLAKHVGSNTVTLYHREEKRVRHEQIGEENDAS